MSHPRETGQGSRPSEMLDPKILQEQFDRVLKDRFGAIPLGCNFRSEVPGVDNVAILSPKPSPGARQPDQAHLHIRYQERGVKKGATFSITRDGRVLGLIPRSLAKHLTPGSLLHEALNHLERIKPSFWIELEDDILPEGILPEGPWPKGKGTGRAGGGGVEGLDSRRIGFLTNLPGAIGGFISKQQGGFNGYRGVIFPDFIYLENYHKNNAVYFMDDIPPLNIRFGMTEEEIRELIKSQPWTQKLKKSKYELWSTGHERHLHKGEWESGLLEKIRARLAQYKQKTTRV